MLKYLYESAGGGGGGGKGKKLLNCLLFGKLKIKNEFWKWSCDCVIGYLNVYESHADFFSEMLVYSFLLITWSK